MRKIKEILQSQKIEKSEGLRKDEFENFFFVEENNPLKNLNINDFKSTYRFPLEEQDSYAFSFHKNGKTVLFILNHW